MKLLHAIFAFWRSYAFPWQLAKRGIMGMNRRNISYISRYNPRHLYPLVDDKLKTKQLAINAGVTVPKLLGVVREQHDVADLDHLLAGQTGFCIKPARGSGGKGILVISGREGADFVRNNGQVIPLSEVQRHVTNILSGLFSLAGKPDVALIEALIEFDPCFDAYSFEGVPDTRVIIFQGFPVMAMMRLSTKASDGKANLHQGAVGVGLDIATGRALHAVQYDLPVRWHPDTGADLLALEVPHWNTLLEVAVACYDMTGLGYLGADVVLDKNLGPMMLELNARPGLSIQVANHAGLLPRLRKIEALGKHTRMSVQERVRFAMREFGAQPTDTARLALAGITRG